MFDIQNVMFLQSDRKSYKNRQVRISLKFEKSDSACININKTGKNAI